MIRGKRMIWCTFALGCAVAVCNIAAAEAPQRISPTGTWLRVDGTLPKDEGGPDTKTAPTKIDLKKHKLKSKEAIAIKILGAYTHINAAGKRERIALADGADGDYDQLKDRNGSLPFNKKRSQPLAFFDPVPGGYRYQAADFQKRLPVRDDLPWYLDEKHRTNGSVGKPTQLDESTKGDYTLQFYDAPDVGFQVGDEATFLTGLVGVHADGRQADLILGNGTLYQWKADGFKVSGKPTKSLPSHVKTLLSKSGIGVRDLQN